MYRVVFHSRDEFQQLGIKQIFPRTIYFALHYVFGYVRDEARLRRALKCIDVEVHSATLKQVPAAEFNRFACIMTNMPGAKNLIEACLDEPVSRAVASSTGKAAKPISLYCKTDLCPETL